MQKFQQLKNTRPYKPRSLKGTPLGNYTNRFALIALTGLTFIGVFLQISPLTARMRQRFIDFCYESPEAKERRYHMTIVPHLSSEGYKEAQAVLDDPFQPFQ